LKSTTVSSRIAKENGLQSFAGACKRSDITNFSVHDCRHTWATWHYAANRHISALMRLGGWKTVSMVIRYVHSNVDEHRHTIERLPGRKFRGKHRERSEIRMKRNEIELSDVAFQSRCRDYSGTGLRQTKGQHAYRTRCGEAIWTLAGFLLLRKNLLPGAFMREFLSLLAPSFDLSTDSLSPLM